MNKRNKNNKPLSFMVCGYERGGTTLISEVLKQHPMLNSGFEGGFLLTENIPDFLNFEPYYTNFKRGWKCDEVSMSYICQANSWIGIYKRVVECSPIIENKDSWIFDKTPKYMEHLPNVLEKIPEVPCIVIVRDPRSVLYSWAKRSNLTKEEWVKRVIKSASQRYTSYAQGYRKALEKGFGCRILLVQYENICINPTLEFEKIFEFIDFEFDDKYLSFQSIFSNVHGSKISNSYLKEYKDNFSKETCKSILEITKDFSEWFW